MHIVSGCKMLCNNKYLFRHNQICTYLHCHLLRDRGSKVSQSWLKHKPAEVVHIGDTIIYWDQTLITDKWIKGNRPDITIWNVKDRTAQLIDVSVPMDTNIIMRTADKLTKYRDLEIEIQKCWNLTKVETIPVVIGALGTVCDNLHLHVKNVSEEARVQVIQKTALLGTAHILRNFLKKEN